MSIASVLDAVRATKPLVHCCTNVASMTTVADGLLAAGASPCMTDTAEEAPSIAAVAGALLVNLGTLGSDSMRGIPAAVDAAVGAGVPWVLDPPGIGLMPVRTRMAGELLATRAPTIVRCNGSEALVLAGLSAGGKGADSTATPDDALEAARELARRHGLVMAVSGPVDVITDGERVVRLANGDPMLTLVTGTGCTLGGIVAACAAVADPWEAAVAASAWVAVAGEHARRTASGPGTFKAHWMDALWSLSGAQVEREARLS